jgi:holin-like protein
VLNAITVLLLFQLAGEALTQLFSLPIPGPVLGMGLLFLALSSPKWQPEALRQTTHDFLQHLSLLFVPAGVGVLQHFHRVAQEWLPITLALILSAMLTVAVTALTIRALARLTPANRHGEKTT